MQVQSGQPSATDMPAWMKTLAVQPGSSLPAEGGQYFVAGSGYAEINGGGTYFCGMNRAQDPFLELTILPSGSPALEECRRLLVPASFEKHAVAVSGVGYFAPMPGVQNRQLGAFRLDTLAGCKPVRRL